MKGKDLLKMLVLDDCSVEGYRRHVKYLKDTAIPQVIKTIPDKLDTNVVYNTSIFVDMYKSLIRNIPTQHLIFFNIDILKYHSVNDINPEYNKTDIITYLTVELTVIDSILDNDIIALIHWINRITVSFNMIGIICDPK